MDTFVSVDGKDLKYESIEYEEKSKQDMEDEEWRKPRMFTLEQMRDLVYLNLNRSCLKNIV